MQPQPQPTVDAFDQAASAQGLPTSIARAAPGGTPAQSQPTQNAAPAQGDAFDQAAAQHDGSFQAPASGHTIQPGDIVHLNGHAGVAKGINPKTGKMIVDWGSKPRWNPFSTPVEDTSEVTPSNLGATPNALTSFTAGVGSSLNKTIQGAAKIVHAPKSAQSTLAADQQQLSDAKNVNPTVGGAGSIAGDILQFMAGEGMVDAAGKAIPLADAMTQSGKIAKAVEKFPKLAKAFQAALKAGATQGAIGTVSSGGDLGEGAKEGLAAGATMGAGSLAGSVIPTVFRKLYPVIPDAVDTSVVEDPQPVYDTLHQGIRNIINNALTDTNSAVVGPEAPTPTTAGSSIRDVVKDAATNVRTQASGLYKRLDKAIEDATGVKGRFQAHDENLDALEDKLKDAIGDPELQAKYSQAIREEQAAKDVTMQHIKDAGLENVPEQATALHKKARALEDLSKAVQASTDGTHPSVATPDSAPERVDPSKLSRNLYKLWNQQKYGGRRLEQALGDHTHDILSLADNAKIALDQLDERAAARAEQAAKVAENIKAAKARRAKTLITAGALPVVGGILHKGHSILNAIEGLVE
jgi:hypothetical protein